ncbi:MAG TPA: hypothetical protein VGY58_21830 [Gemmataceae bacterium]|nr:hypothetical protein [Gemmataceae bacterium]
MNSPFRTLLVRLAGGMLSALLAGSLYAPAPVHAACGDYVTLGGQAMAAHGDPGAVHAHKPQASEQQRAPCSGPHCSRQAPSGGLPPAPPVQVRSAHDQCGCNTIVQASHDAASNFLLWESVPATPLRLALSIYHPPR